MSILVVITALNPGISHHTKKILFKPIVHSLTISIMGRTKVGNLIKMPVFFSAKMTWQNFITDQPRRKDYLHGCISFEKSY
jgi:hypothetical protein